MTRVLVVTETPSFDVKLRFALPALGVDVRVAGTLGEAARELRSAAYDAAVIDLRWSASWSGSLAAWVYKCLTIHGIRAIFSAETPLARNLRYAFPLREAVFLGRDFDVLDVVEAIDVRTLEVA